MAYVQTFNTRRKEEDTNPYGGFTTTANAGVSDQNALSPETGLLKDTSGGKLANAQSGGSGRFVNLQNYLDANKQQAVGLSQGVGQHIAGEVDKANTDLQTATNTYKADVAKNTKAYDQNVVSNVIANPNAAANAENVRKFQDLASGAYAGPTVSTTGTFDPAISAVREAQTAGENVKNAGGQVALLKGMSTDRPYTTGGYNFNQLLLQNNDLARQNITESGKLANPLQQNLTNAFTGAAEATTAAQLNNMRVADQARAAVAAETTRLEQKWKEDALAMDAANQAHSDELMNKLANLGTGGNDQYAAADAAAAKWKENQYIRETLSQMANAQWKSHTSTKVGNALDAEVNKYRQQATSGTISVNTGDDTSMFSDQDMKDLGMTRAQMSNLLRSRQRVINMGGTATDLSQWMAPYINTTTAAGAATSEDANRYNNLNLLIGQAPTQNVSQAALDAAKADKTIFSSKEAYVRMQTEMNTIQAQQQAKWAKEQELKAAQMVADAQKAAAKAQMTASLITAGLMLVFQFFSDENLKTDIKEMSGDDITNILNDLTGAK